MKKIVFALALMVSSFAAQAAETYLETINGQYGQVGYTRTAEGWVSATVYVDGEGINRTASMFTVSYSYVDGYKFWRGSLPNSTVTTNGVSSISVDVDTCALEPVNAPGCGYNSFTVTANTPANGWINNGVVSYEYSDLLVRYVGASQVRMSTGEGIINGQSFTGARAFTGTSDNVYVQITVGQ